LNIQQPISHRVLTELSLLTKGVPLFNAFSETSGNIAINNTLPKLSLD